MINHFMRLTKTHNFLEFEILMYKLRAHRVGIRNCVQEMNVTILGEKGEWKTRQARRIRIRQLKALKEYALKRCDYSDRGFYYSTELLPAIEQHIQHLQLRNERIFM